MKLHITIKVVFFLLSLLVILAVVFVALEYPKLKQGKAQNAAVDTQTNGTACSPDSLACKGNPELCMTENLNKVCD